MKRPVPLLILISCLSLLAGCSSKSIEYYYSVAKRSQAMPEFNLTITVVQRFERLEYCESNSRQIAKAGFETECRHEDKTLEPMFRGEPAGKWYASQSIGPFSPAMLIYETEPQLPDEVMIKQLEMTAPHILKFAALQQTPGWVRIFAPGREIPRIRK